MEKLKEAFKELQILKHGVRNEYADVWERVEANMLEAMKGVKQIVPAPKKNEKQEVSVQSAGISEVQFKEE